MQTCYINTSSTGQGGGRRFEDTIGKVSCCDAWNYIHWQKHFRPCFWQERCRKWTLQSCFCRNAAVSGRSPQRSCFCGNAAVRGRSPQRSCFCKNPAVSGRSTQKSCSHFCTNINEYIRIYVCFFSVYWWPFHFLHVNSVVDIEMNLFTSFSLISLLLLSFLVFFICFRERLPL